MTDAGSTNSQALDWVRGELDETLKQAAQSLEFFVENTGDEYELASCAEALHQVIGTLRLVQLDGAVLYAEQMVDLLDAVRDDRVERSEAIFEALMRGLLQLPAYLEYIQAGGADLPQALLTEINELRQLGGAAPIGAETFFDVALDALPPAPAQPAASSLQALAAKARPTYQKALVTWLRQPQDPNALRVLLRVCELLRQAAGEPAQARLWWAAGGLFEGLGAGAIKADATAKQLLTALDRQLKGLAEHGAIDDDQVPALTRALLYRVAQVAPCGPQTQALDAAFDLAGRVPSAELVEEVERRLHGPDTAVLRSVAEAVKEDFNRARDIIEIFGASNAANPRDLEPLRDNLGRMADTLGMMGLNGLADTVRAQRGAVQGMIDGTLAADEAHVVDVAEVLLHVDTFLIELADVNQHALRVTDVLAAVPATGPNRGGIAQPRQTDLELRQVARGLFQVGLQELEQVREAVIALTDERADAAALTGQPQRLVELAGGLHMLGHEQAALLLGQLAGVLEQARYEPLAGVRLECLADALTALESTLRAYQTDQAVGRFLELAEERLGGLLGPQRPRAEVDLDFELEDEETAAAPEAPVDFDLPGEAGDLPTGPLPAAEEFAADAEEADEALLAGLPADDQVPLEEDAEELVAGLPVVDDDHEPLEEATEALPAELLIEAHDQAPAEPPVAGQAATETAPAGLPDETLPEPGKATPVEPAAVAAEAVPGVPVLSDDYDAETLDIFLEEADEVVAALREQVPQWCANPGDSDLPGDIRRAFHTLKGSGRLVGAMLIGEFAWGYENLLNRVLEGTRPAGEELFDTLARGVALLPGMVDQLRGGPSPGGAVGALMAATAALAEGRPLPATPAVPSVAPAAAAPTADQGGAAEEVTAEEVEPPTAALDTPPGGVAPAVADAGVELPEPAEAEPDQIPVLIEGYDVESLAIFLEEADEVVAALRAQLPRWCADPADRDLLGDLRRGFQTLKGSSRLVGALLIGEFAAAYELLLDRVLEGARPAGPELFETLDRALALLPALVDQLRGGPPTGSEVGVLLRAAEALAEPAPLPAQAEAAEEAAATETPSAAPVEPPTTVAVATPPAARIDDQLYAIYRPEAETHLATLTAFVDQARGGGSAVPTEAVVRALHTLRGSSGMTEARPVAELAALLEEHCKPLLATGQPLAPAAVEQLAEATGLIERMVAALGDAALEFPDASGLAERLRAADLPEADTASVDAASAAASATNELLISGADLIDLLDDGVSRWVAASADSEPLRQLAHEAAELAREAAAAGQPSIAEICTLLDTFIGLLAGGRYGPEAWVLDLLDDTGSSLTAMFDSLAVSRPAEPDPTLVVSLRARIDEASRAAAPAADEAPEPVPAAAATEVATAASEPVAASVPAAESAAQWMPAEALDPDLLEIFLQEGSELLDQAEATVHRWQERVDDREAMALLQRQLHTLKGGARMAGIVPMGDLSHVAESLLTGVVEGRLEPSATLFDLLNETVDRLVGMLEAVREQQPVALAPTLVEDLHELAGGRAPASVAEPTPETGEVTAADAVADTTDDTTAPAAASGWSPAVPLDPDLLEIFLEEGRDLLDEAETTVHRWQENVADRDTVALLQRQLHTLKGGARMAGIVPMGDLSHVAESLLTGVVEGRLEPSATLFDLLNETVDRLAQMLEAVRHGRPLAPAYDLDDALTALIEGRRPAPALAPLPEVELPPAVAPPKSWAEAKPAEVAETPAPAPAAAAPRPAMQQEQVRVPAQLLNNLVNLAGEVSIYRSRLEQQNNVLRFNLGEFEQTVVRLRDQLRRLEIETDAQIMSRLEIEGRTIEDFDPLEMDQYTALQTVSRALLESLNDLTNVREYLDDLTRESDTLLLQQSRVNTELQQGLMQARMMPFSRLVPRMRRIVRQTAQEMGKRVELWVQGEHSEVDGAVVDRIVAPLEHLIRNAIAHGIEAPEARTAAGKDPVGKLTLTVDRDGSDIIFRVKDDGAGIDVERVRQKAVERGLLAPDAEVSEHDILQFIFESGMSTAQQVTQVSGRGVGMDVVISETRQLGGTVEINSKQGFGASFYIRLPFTLAVNRALLVTVGDELFAIPLTSIEGIVRLRAAELQAFYAGEREHYIHAGSDYQVRHLGALLGTSTPRFEADQERIPVLLVRSGDQGMALHVDGLIGSREIVVKSVGPQLSTVRGLFGATILVDGRVALILDTNALARMGAQLEATQARAAAVETAAAGPQRTTVMIVDDSITVRRVTARLLERHAYRVITAKDGVDALQVLQGELPDIMLLDIEMPRMDGFELAQHVRGDPRLQRLPIIMITSRTGDKHRQRGLEIGVDRFLGKPYQDVELLESITELTAAAEHADA
jgi:chemosensory pili system protein ChpA (sensor histidine kinase/response regulator)